MISHRREEPQSDVNYDCPPLLEMAIDDVEYRVDAGRQGTAMCVSTRSPGSWDWVYHGEVSFDGRDVRSKALDRRVRERLSAALVEAIKEMEQ